MLRSREVTESQSQSQIHSGEDYQDTEELHANVGTRPSHEIKTQSLGEEKSESDKTEEKTEPSAEREATSHDKETTYEGIMDGIPFEQDVEVPPLPEKKRSETPTKDPNLVSSVPEYVNRQRVLTTNQVTWDSEDDPDNPKNCE